jgi:signal transduction histidine kinase
MFDESEKLNEILSVEKSLLNQRNIGIIRVDNSGYPIYINDCLLHLLDFENLQEFYDYFSNNPAFQKNTDPQKYYNFLKLEIKSNFLESKWVNKTGKIIFLKEFVVPIRNNKDEIVYYDVIIEDITNLKLVDELIKKYQMRDLSILKALPDLLFLISSNGVFLDFKYNNKNNFNLFSNPLEIIGKRVEEIFPTETAHLIFTAINKTLSDEELQTVEFSIENLGKLAYFEARIIYNTSDQALVLLRDITVQKLAEAELRTVTEDLQAANIEKDKFFSLIAHDLRTPLVGLTGYAEILAADIEVLSKEEIREYSNSIVEISRQTIKFLSNLLEWSRLQIGKIRYEPTDVSINRMVDSVYQLLKSNLKRKDINFLNLTNPEHIVYADENMIYSVINNLISNAIKFTNTNGEIIVSSKEEDDKIITSVKDNGIGMSDEQMDNLFVLNKSFTTQGTAKEKGTGLGLILCRDFINKNFGKLYVKSKEGEGTEFSFSLPKFKN